MGKASAELYFRKLRGSFSRAVATSVVIVILHAGQSARAEPWKCATVSPISGPLGYQHRGDGSRCEGLYEPTVSSQRIDLLNLTNAIPRSGSPKFAQISVPSSLTDVAGLHVVGLSLVPDTFYRLDAPISPARPAMIPTSDVIMPGGLDLSQLGFVGYSDKWIIPLNVQLTNTNQPVTIISIESI